MDELLSRIGIGAATVDTVLPSTTLTAGETVEARVDVRGGAAAQDVDAIYFAILTRYETDDGRSTGVVDQFRIADQFTIDADEARSFAVDITLPRETPVTDGRTNVWIETGLDIDWALDPEDEDPIEVEPDPHRAALFEALDALGFELKAADCVSAAGSHLGGQFVQELEYVPRSGSFAGALDELEVVPRPADEGYDVFLEVDRRGGLLSELADVDERMTRVTLETTESSRVRADLEAAIETHS